MSFFKKLFQKKEAVSNKEKKYNSSDNLGTNYTDYIKVNAAWKVQGMMLDKGEEVNLYRGGTHKKLVAKGHPYICYTFNNQQDAKAAMSSISYFKIAQDTFNFISLEVLEFGCYETETLGEWEVIIWGENFTKELFDEAKSKLSKSRGKIKGERAAQKASIKAKPTKQTKAVEKPNYIRTDYQGANTYDIYSAKSKSAALEFLKNKSVTKSLYYVIIETPEGNWGKDINGIYQE